MKTLKQLAIKDSRHLALLLHSTPEQIKSICKKPSRYCREWDNTRNGKTRHRVEAQGPFRDVLKALNGLLQRLQFGSNVYGGLKGKSHIKSAEVHARKPVLLKTDIKDFFKSITPQKVYSVFVDDLACSPDVGRLLTRLTTLNGCLPEGYPTSPVVANLVAANLAKRIKGLSDKHSGASTSYVDDLGVSGPEHVAKLKNTLLRIVEQEGFIPNPLKTSAMGRDTEQVYVGTRVNEGLDISSKKLGEVKAALGQVEKAVTEGAPVSRKQLNSLRGKVNYVSRLNPGAASPLFKRLREIEAISVDAYT